MNIPKGYIELEEAIRISGKTYETLKHQCEAGLIRGALRYEKSWAVPRSEIVLPAPQPLDTALGLLVLMAEGFTFGPFVTLYINGAMVTGRLISTKHYLTTLRSQLKVTIGYETKPHENPEFRFEQLLDSYFKSVVDDRPADGPRETHFIHMDNIATLGFGDPSSMEGALLRIRIDSVDGFIHGKAEASKNIQ